MADKQVQIRKGTTAQNDSFTGALGEMSFDTQQNRLRLHDGVTVGGHQVAMLNISNTFTDAQNINADVNINNNILLMADGNIFAGNTTIAPDGHIDINTNTILNIDGSAQFAGGQLTISSAGVIGIASGSNQRAGNATMVAGTVTVANTTVTADTIVLLTRKTSGGTPGTLITYTVTAATSFTINSDSALDTSTFSYFLIEVP